MSDLSGVRKGETVIVTYDGKPERYEFVRQYGNDSVSVEVRDPKTGRIYTERSDRVDKPRRR